MKWPMLETPGLQTNLNKQKDRCRADVPISSFGVNHGPSRAGSFHLRTGAHKLDVDMLGNWPHTVTEAVLCQSYPEA